MEVRDKTSASSYETVEKLWKRDYIAFAQQIQDQKKTCKFRKSFRKKVSELLNFWISELVTSINHSQPHPQVLELAFVIVLMATRVFFVVNTIRKARDLGTLS